MKRAANIAAGNGAMCSVGEMCAGTAARGWAAACGTAARGWVAALLLAAILLLVATLAFPTFAWAANEASQATPDEAADGDNAVDLQQLPDSSFIYDTTIGDLGAADTYYDEQTVQVTGEVVGDWIDGDDARHCWITLADDGATDVVSVCMTTESASKIDTYGKYNVKGTTLQVRGTYHIACPDHEGVSDLHADVVTVVKAGKSTNDEFAWQHFIPGALLIVVGGILTGAYYIIRERQR